MSLYRLKLRHSSGYLHEIEVFAYSMPDAIDLGIGEHRDSTCVTAWLIERPSAQPRSSNWFFPPKELPPLSDDKIIHVDFKNKKKLPRYVI